MKVFIWGNKNTMIHKYKNRLFGLFSVLVIFGVTGVLAISTCAKEPQKVEVEESIVSSTTCSVTAELYDNLACTGVGTALTESGITVSGWTEKQSKFLKITASANVDDGKQHMIEVELPKEFYVVTTKIDEVPVGFASVNFVKNSDITVMGGTETYYVKNTSGKLTYVMSQNIASATITLEIRYDEVFWDKQQGSSITANGVNPIRVAAKHVGESVYIREVKVSKVLAGEGTTRWVWNKINTELYDYATTKTKALDAWMVSGAINDEYLYYKDVDIIVSLPYWTDTNGNKYYLTSNQSGIEVLKTTHPNVKYTVSIATGVVTIHIDDFYCMTNVDSIIVPMTLPTNLPYISDKYITFINGNVTIKGTSNNGTNNLEVFNSDMNHIQYQVDATEDIVISESGNIKAYLDTARDGVTFMGGFYLENKGCVNSTRKTITYNFPDKLLATTLNMFCDPTSQYITVEYSMKDDVGNTIYFDSSGNVVSAGTAGATTTCTYNKYNPHYQQGCKSDAYETFSRWELPQAHRQYFFSSIKFTLGTIVANAQYFQESALASNVASGNYYGYLRSDVKKGDVLMSTFKVESPSGSGFATLEEEIETQVTDELITSTIMTIYDLDQKNTHVNAGENIVIGGEAGGFSYPYGTTLKVSDMNLGLLLPEGILLDKENVTLKTSVGVPVEVEKVYIKDSKDGKNFWVIEVDSDVRVGYYNEYLDPMNGGWGIVFSITMATDISMPTTNLYTHEMFSFAGKGHDNKGYGTNCSYDDVWDLNEDGKTDSGIAVIPEKDTKLITITGNSLMIDVEDSISVGGKGEIKENVAILNDKDDEVTYSINVNRLELGTVTIYNHYISIPKQNSVRDAFLVQGEEGGGFDFKLSRAVTFDGTDMFEALYTTEEGLSFNDIRDLGDNKWYSIDEIEEFYSLSEVTAVKIVLKDGNSISTDFNANINVHMLSTNNNNIALGEINTWKSRAYYSFNHSSGTVAGYCATNGCAAEIAYEPPENEDTEDDVEDNPIKDGDSIIKDKELSEYDDTPDTGDNRYYWYWTWLMVMSALGVYACSKKIRCYIKK